MRSKGLDTPRKWKNYFISIGLPIQIVEIYHKYVKKILKNSVPVIFDFTHLCQLLGRTSRYLSSVVNSAESHYRSFELKKRNGGTRRIDAPYPALLECQKWINSNILKKVNVDVSAHAYRRGRSIITNAEKHLNANCLLRIDIKDFFPTITIRQVIAQFRKLGYSQNVSVYLGRICTLNDRLPQGAATSPVLSNIVFKPVDARLRGLSSKYSLVYTRYSDDLIFSGDWLPLSFLKIVTKIIEEHGFSINEKKTYLSRKKGKRVVTGISIGNGELKIPRTTKRELKKQLFFIKKYGFLSHISKIKIREPFYMDSLIGKVVFWLQIEPENTMAKEYLELLKKIKNEKYVLF